MGTSSESSKQLNLMHITKMESCKNFENQRWQENVLVREKMLNKEFHPTIKSTSVKMSRDSTKKWWKILDWLPGFKSFRIQRRLAYNQNGIRDNIVLENNPLNEFSINGNNLRLV